MTSAARALSPADLLVLKPDQAAALLGIGRTKVYELIAAGDLPTITVYAGGPVRITRAAVDAYVAARVRAAETEHATYLSLVAPKTARGQRNTR